MIARDRHPLLSAAFAVHAFIAFLFFVSSLLWLVDLKDSNLEKWGVGIGVGMIVGGMWMLLLLVAGTFALAQMIMATLASAFLWSGKHRTFCLVAAAIVCIALPIGTILGIATIVTLGTSRRRTMGDLGYIDSSTKPFDARWESG